MTNIVASLLIQLGTNWTGYNYQGKEVGFVSTNHYARVVYQNSTNEFYIKSDASSIAVWRVWRQENHGWYWGGTNKIILTPNAGDTHGDK